MYYVYKKAINDCIKCVLCYVLDGDNNIIATLDFDKKIKFIKEKEIVSI